jgi:transposase
MHNYPSDISREAFEIIRGNLESAKKRTKPRKIDLYDIFCALLYLIKSGCQWRMLPKDFPKMGIVRYYYDVRTAKRKDGSTVLTEVLKKIGNTDTQRRYEERQNDLRYH